MADTEQNVPSGAQLTLRHSPTGGAPGEHSPYYRRLLSAGYKGYLQGVIGGSTLYGGMGAVIGTIIAAPLALGLFAPAAPLAWLLIPSIAGIGIFKGASTFGYIGSMAAISAEGSEMNEERRYLLERYYDLPLSHEYDGEAREIERLLVKQHEVKRPKHIFHWKTVLVCATIGIAIGAGLAAFAPEILTLLHIPEMLTAANLITATQATHLAALSVPSIMLAVSGAIGGLVGTMIGLDRYYVRRWLDAAEHVVTDPEQVQGSLRSKQRDVERLIEASPTQGAETSAGRRKTVPKHPSHTTVALHTQTPAEDSERPATSVTDAQLDSRMAKIQAAMHRPAV